MACGGAPVLAEYCLCVFVQLTKNGPVVGLSCVLDRVCV